MTLCCVAYLLYLEVGACLLALTVAVDDTGEAAIGDSAVPWLIPTLSRSCTSRAHPKEVIQDLDTVTSAATQSEHAAVTLRGHETSGYKRQKNPSNMCWSQSKHHSF